VLRDAADRLIATRGVLHGTFELFTDQREERAAYALGPERPHPHSHHHAHPHAERLTGGHSPAKKKSGARK
jgi:hypothetical protein